MERWLKLYAKFADWEWHTKPEMVSVFVHLLVCAAGKDGAWQGIPVKRGQVAIGRRALATMTGLTEQKVRTCLQNLKSTGEITIEPTNRLSIITICNYDRYQDKDFQVNQQINQQTNQESTNQPERKEEPRKERVSKKGEDMNKKKKNLYLYSSPSAHAAGDTCEACDAREKHVPAQGSFSFLTLSVKQQGEERSSFFKTFFWGNAWSPDQAVKEFIRFNEKNGWKARTSDTVYGTPSQRLALAEEWAQDDRFRRRSEDYTWIFRGIVDNLSDMWPDIEDLLLWDGTGAEVTGTKESALVTIHCPHEAMTRLMTKEGTEVVQALLRPGCRIHYTSTPITKR